MSRDPLVADIVELLGQSVDAAALRERVAPHFAGEAGRTTHPADAVESAPGSTSPGAAGALSAAAEKLQSRIGLADILDDSILQAARGDTAFPLRLFFGELVADCAENDVAFSLASGLNLYFRAVMGEEAKLAVAMEVSRLYYKYARAQLERELLPTLSPLLAQLMSTELDKTDLESVDHQRVFDSANHERDGAADATRSAIVAPLTFLCRVSSTGRPRFKAMVLT